MPHELSLTLFMMAFHSASGVNSSHIPAQDFPSSSPISLIITHIDNIRWSKYNL
jgi:hypothetical protein